MKKFLSRYTTIFLSAQCLLLGLTMLIGFKDNIGWYFIGGYGLWYVGCMIFDVPSYVKEQEIKYKNYVKNRGF